jgi:hypothetical protein
MEGAGMDGKRFDRLTQLVAATPWSRRRVIGGAASVGLAGILGTPPANARRLRPTLTAPAARTCRSFCENCFGCETCFGCCFCGSCTCPKSTGIAGGGTVDYGGGEATLIAFASRLRVSKKHPQKSQLLGRVQWVDEAQNLRLESTQITTYGPPSDDASAREVQGLARVNGHEDVPFILRASGVDGPHATVSLRAGDELLVLDEEVLISLAGPPSGIAYDAEGTLVAGGLELLEFESFERPARTAR